MTKIPPKPKNYQNIPETHKMTKIYPQNQKNYQNTPKPKNYQNTLETKKKRPKYPKAKKLPKYP